MIEFQNIEKYFGKKHVIKNLNLKIEKGKFVMLIGPSGSGKTTTLKMINRLIEPSSGNIYINNESIRDKNVIDLRREIGYVIQEVGLFPNMTVLDNVTIVPKLLNWPKDKYQKRAKELLELVDMPYEDYAHRYPSELSGGQQQRIGVLRAMAAKPPVILMDEPFGALDPITREKLQDEFKIIQKELGLTIVFVTHDMDEAIKMGDEIIFMNEGRIIQQDSPEEMLRNPASPVIKKFMERQMNDSFRDPLDMKCHHLMRKNVFKVQQNRSILECLELIRRRDLESAVVVDEKQRYQGIVWRDHLLKHRKTINAQVKDFLDTNVPVFHLEDDAKDAVKAIEEDKHQFVVVADSKNIVRGLVTRGSITRSLSSLIWGDIRD